MNKNGNPGTLVASHPENTNAMKHGVYSERRIQSRAAQIATDLIESFEFLRALAERARHELGVCPACRKPVRGHDYLVSGRCPHCA